MIKYPAQCPVIENCEALHEETPKDAMRTLSLMDAIADAKVISEAALYLTEVRSVAWEVTHADGGVRVVRW